MSAMNQFTPRWQSRFACAYAETALGTGQAQHRLHRGSPVDRPDQRPESSQLETRLRPGPVDRGPWAIPSAPCRSTTPSARAPLDMLSAPAQMHAAELRLQLGQINQTQAISLLDALRFRWRGRPRGAGADPQSSAGSYLEGGHYREALETLNSISDVADRGRRRWPTSTPTRSARPSAPCSWTASPTASSRSRPWPCSSDFNRT